MDAYDLVKWREMYFDLDRVGAAKAIRVSANSLRYWEEGKRPIPAYVPLLCDAIANSLKGWTLPKKMRDEKRENPHVEVSKPPRGVKAKFVRIPVEEYESLSKS